MATLTTATSTTSATATYTYPYALTTTFSPPSSCFAPTYTLRPAGYDVEYAAHSEIHRGLDPACYPSNNYLTANALWFSPGICPEGYSTVQAAVSAGGTLATCCPSGMLILTRTGGSSFCAASGKPEPVTIFDGTSSSRVYAAYNPAASIIRVSNKAVPSAAVAGLQSYTTLSTQTGTSHQASIGVGLLLGGIVLAGLSVFACCLRKKSRYARYQRLDNVGHKVELPADSMKVAELDAAEIYEVGGRPDVAEADNANQMVELHSDDIVELEGEWLGWGPISEKGSSSI
ncbi:hypothetical protein AMS68_006215 [Peltaster fructicola]|uniref:Uncharacterized protein n=1 Tax=Peltaster fructicola TaxID=286661 RepID=A0A6H0Y1H1_9PEZI|nr:hypothetical protein AMS68_006215 [Peltaster fructicola]